MRVLTKRTNPNSADFVWIERVIYRKSAGTPVDFVA